MESILELIYQKLQCSDLYKIEILLDNFSVLTLYTARACVIELEH